MCSSRQVCTKKAYEDILPLGLLGSPLAMVTGGVYLEGQKPGGGRRRGSTSRPNPRWPASPPPNPRASSRRAPLPRRTTRPRVAAATPPPRTLSSAEGGGSRREQSRPRLPPRATLRVPPGGRRRRRPLTGPGGGRERRRRPPDPFPTETSPGFHVASPTKSCRLATGSKSTKPGTGPGRVSRPLSTAPGPSPARNLDSARRGEPRGPGAQGGQRAEREGERQAHEPRRGRRGFLPGGRSSQRPSKQQAPAETLPSLGSGVNWFIAYPILRLLFCRLLRATAT